MGAGAAAWTLGFLDTKSGRLEKYLHGVQGVEGSNPFTPDNNNKG